MCFGFTVLVIRLFMCFVCDCLLWCCEFVRLLAGCWWDWCWLGVLLNVAFRFGFSQRLWVVGGLKVGWFGFIFPVLWFESWLVCEWCLCDYFCALVVWFAFVFVG